MDRVTYPNIETGAPLPEHSPQTPASSRANVTALNSVTFEDHTAASLGCSDPQRSRLSKDASSGSTPHIFKQDGRSEVGGAYRWFSWRPAQSPSAPHTAVESFLPKTPQAISTEANTAHGPQKRDQRGGHFRNFPWSSIIELSVVFLVAFGVAILVVCIDGNEEWPTRFSVGKIGDAPSITPQVVLSIGHSIIAFLIVVASKNGISVAWWRKLFRGGTLRAIHRNYQLGSSLKDASIAGKHTNIFALATIGAALATLAQGPLAQRALTTYLGTKESNVTLQTRIANSIPVGFTTMNGLFTPDFEQAVKEYMSNAPIRPALSECHGICKASVPAAGFAPSCDITETKYFAHVLRPAGDEGKVVIPENLFLIDFDEHFKNRYDENHDQLLTFWVNLTLQTRHSTTNHFRRLGNDRWLFSGQTTMRKCILQPAVIKYPVIVQNVSAQPYRVTLDPDIKPMEYSVVSRQTYGGIDGKSTPFNGRITFLETFTGLKQALNMIWGAQHFKVLHEGPQLAGPYKDLLFEIKLGKHSVQNYLNMTLSELQDFQTSAILKILDPTEDMIGELNQLTFRTAIKATDASTPATSVSSQQTGTVSRYRVSYGYIIASVAVTAVSIIFILPTFWGYWELTREVSLSPVEILEAFNAPAVYNQEVYKDVDDLMKLVGDRRVVYVRSDSDGLLKHDKQVWKVELIDGGKLS